jgi:MraZ protein
VELFQNIVQHTMDAKGRVSLPAEYRARLAAADLVLVEGVDSCLWLFERPAYDRFIEPLLEDEYDETLDELRDSFIAGASKVEVDSTGRIRVPQGLRSYACLQKNVTIAGKGTRLELWDAEAYAARRAGFDKRKAVRELQERRKQRS